MSISAALSEQPFYQRFPARVSVKKLDQRICVSDDPEFVYFRIPKAANTNVIASLYYAVHGNLDVSINVVNQYKMSFRRPSGLSEFEVGSLLSTHVSFTVVRNPFARLLSVYLEKLVYGTTLKAPTLERLGKGPDGDISIDEFLEFLEGGGLRKDLHWCRQVDLVPVGIDKLSFVGRVESIAADVGGILSSIFGRPCIFRDFHQRRTNAASRIHEFLTPERQKKIVRLYGEDFEQLAYSTNLNDEYGAS